MALWLRNSISLFPLPFLRFWRRFRLKNWANAEVGGGEHDERHLPYA
jgi:hypothetical protein